MNKNDSKSILQGCLSNINHQSHLMKQCLNDSNLLQALKHCSNFLNELRINQLSPKQYYELYIAVFDSLDYLCNHLLASYKAKHKKNTETPFLTDLYELVQYSGNIVPRLYMLIAVGTTFISTNNAPTEAIMKDMIEMCRGVQNPIRGLFLRYYLSQRIKDLLPIGTKHEFDETVTFLINNFIEMNKLWVRLQHQGHSSERELRYQERKELKILVGSNLVRLSQIIDDFTDDEYSPESYYKDHVFPIIIEQVIQCKDHLAQTYLIDVIIQIFPDNFHFITLNMLLNNLFLNLNPTLNKSELISTLIERFINYHQQQQDEENGEENEKEEEMFTSLRLFDEFWGFYEKLTTMNVPLEEHSSILQSFIRLSLVFERDNYENLNKIYKFVTENFSSEEIDEKIWLNLLITPIQNFDSISSLLKLSFFNEFYNRISNQLYQKQISLEILNKLLDQDEIVCDVKEIDIIFKFLLILIKESNELNVSKQMGIVKTVKIENGEKLVTNEFLINQSNICKVLGKINKNSIDLFEKISNITYVRKKFLNKNLASIVYTYPTVIQLILDILKTIGLINLTKSGKFTNKLINQFKNLSIIIDELYEHHQVFNSQLVLNLYLNCTMVADQLNLPTITFEFFNKCFIVYEETLMVGQGQGSVHGRGINPQDSMNHNSIQYQSILLILNKLNFTRNLPREDYQSLITKLTLYGSKLLKKQDQCRSIYNCGHLFWWTETLETNQTIELFKDDKRVLECLQKSLRVADSCIDPYLSLKLFIEILNKCLVFNIHGNTLVNDNYINGLIELIYNNIENLNNDYDLKDTEDQEYRLFKSLEEYFSRTLQYIEMQKEEERLEDIVTKLTV
ncbi:retromer complex subunit Vps35 [Yamadazyma tenuis]|uniref:Vacuolar protein sorting-associated protein 35 n=1 Tax=Candida tenuis (strain ATCC 10573 / BCRC 21748 / CBS 615 / JCM 9827 / NBRC 10315 / NRRL Y-1498 / VKM Y-70) TaxID=590646 RepID=G3B2I7_CANTC|nr:vacuolar protein sorting-associated protein 35 [Yamadazyma tenuis ATCC 10573]EGV64685.1 vacuolar protein sorting-associated protein 35 [Yamadazyma tenuis ATCC 10573]WEJ97472.1 retromer complex subunit Vps35 [Yamadazyma tenuis]